MNNTPTTTEKAEAQTAENRAQFTPGPWRVETLGDTLRVTESKHEHLNNDVAILGDCRKPVNQANARLIAEAPALFAMVKDYAENADCGNGGEHFGGLGDKAENCWHCCAVALIAKIEGRQS